MQDTLKIKGVIDFEIRDLNGNIRDRWTVNNIITNAGKAQLALLTIDGSATVFTHLAVGTSTTSPAGSQTALGAEVTTSGLGRAVATTSRTTTTATNDTALFAYTWTVTGTQSIEEIGIFNAVSGGTMLGRALTGTRAMVNGETLTANYRVIFG